ncbi:MAG: FecR domain-containing protein [Solitalea sp.]
MQEQDHLEEILRRYLQGECTPEEEALVRSWYRSLGSEREPLSLSSRETSELRHRLWRNIRAGSTGFPDRERARKSWVRWISLSAASAAALLLLFVFLFSQNGVGPGMQRSRQVDTPTVYHKTNNSSETMLVVLQDESMVWLKPSGSIRYRSFLSSPRREVTLEGEAFFEITEQQEKPFLVYTGNIVTRVTGTKFNIKAYKTDKTVEVEVAEGSVEVSGDHAEASRPGTAVRSRTDNLRLTARQKAIYHTNSRKLEKIAAISSQLRPVTDLSQDLAFEFSDTPLRKVIDLLEKAYPVSIELANQDLADCPLTASMRDETLEIKMELICRSIGATFDKSPGKFMISGPGCESE